MYDFITGNIPSIGKYNLVRTKIKIWVPELGFNFRFFNHYTSNKSLPTPTSLEASILILSHGSFNFNLMYIID